MRKGEYVLQVKCLRMTEIRSVFKGPMGNNADVLQSTGGGSKSLVPALSSSYQWTASALAPKNVKTLIYTSGKIISMK